MNKIDLSGRFAVVTGGAQGFGRAITERFAASGAKVMIWDFDDTLAQKILRNVPDCRPPETVAQTLLVKNYGNMSG